MGSSGLARQVYWGGSDIFDPDLQQPIRNPEKALYTTLSDFWWGNWPPTVPTIPVTWLSSPLTLRLEQPFNLAEVTQENGTIARARDTTSITTYRSVYPFTATLSTATDADPGNLASWTVAYNANPRMRSPQVVLDLLYRTDSEKRYILDIQRGRRVRITGLPAQWPSGADSLIVAGVTHVAGEFGRRVVWTTSQVIGTTAGTPGPWFRWDGSTYNGTDVIPF